MKNFQINQKNRNLLEILRNSTEIKRVIEHKQLNFQTFQFDHIETKQPSSNKSKTYLNQTNISNRRLFQDFQDIDEFQSTSSEQITDQLHCESVWEKGYTGILNDSIVDFEIDLIRRWYQSCRI